MPKQSMFSKYSMPISFINKLFHSNHARTLQVRKQIIYSLLVKGVSVIVTFAMVPLMVNVLDQERYGVWLTLSTIFLWFNNFDIGLGNGLRNKLAEAVATKNDELGRTYVSTTYALLSIIFVSIVLLFLAINPFLDWNKILNTNAITSKELFFLSTVTFIFFIFRFIFQLIGVIYMAIQRPVVNNILVTLGSLFAFLIVLALYRLMKISSLLVMGMVLTGIPLLVLIIANIFSFNGDLKQYAPSIKYIRFKYSKELFVLSGQFFIIQIAAVILFSTANILISHLFNPSEVVIYNSVLQYYNIPIMLYAIILTPLWSAITEAYIQKDYAWMKKALYKFNYISVLFILGIAIQTIISPFVYTIWLNGKVFIPMNLSIAMACYAAINVLLSPYTSYINGIGKLRLSVLLVSISIVGYIPFAIWLGHSFGSSLGIVVALCCTNVTGLYFQVRQVNKLLSKKANGIWNK